MLYPLLFKPIFQERIWGGRNLEKLYRKALPPGIAIGESWEISDRDEALSEVRNGPLAGKTLRWIMEHHARGLLGEATSLHGRFPLLVKILDAQEKLSLQVHPPAAMAALFRGEPKTEMWYIAAAKPGAELFVGLNPGTTRAEFEAKINAAKVEECFHRQPVRAGDSMFLPSGRVHAIGAGLVIFEIQQNSDTTFRVFDWDRKDASGKSRPLHVAESLASIDFHDFAPKPMHPDNGTADIHMQTLVEDPLFTVELLQFSRVPAHFEYDLHSARILGVVEGKIRIPHPAHPVELLAGDFCLLPAALERVKIEALAAGKVLLAQPGTA